MRSIRTARAAPTRASRFLTAYYMRTYGARREDFGKLCVAQRNNALKNPLALFKKPLTLDQYLDARLVADPLRLFDCVMPCAGAEGFLVMRRATAEELGLRFARLLGAIERHNAFPDDPMQYRGGWAMDRDVLYAQAGVGPDDIDFLETYDDYPVINVLQFEGLGFCREGEGAAFIRANTFEAGGTFPVQHVGRPVVGRASRRGRRASWHHRSHPPDHRRDDRRARRQRASWSRLGLRHDQLRSRRLQRRCLAGRRLSFADCEGSKGCLNLPNGRSARTRSCARASRRCRRQRAAASRSA